MTIYLDTARMGRFGRRSQLAVADFLRFHSEEGSSVHFDNFLRWGFHGLNVSLRNNYDGLHDWEGIRGLKESVRRLAGASRDSEVLLTSSSAQLLRIATKTLFELCENVFTLDVAWADYRVWLQAAAEVSGRRISELQVSDRMLRLAVSKDHLLEQIVASFCDQKCDGLFIPAVTNFGIRLPYAEIIKAIRSTRPVRFIVIDGAQEFCHVPTHLGESGADFYVTGCHKWMQAHLPMRLGICCRRETQPLVTKVCERMLERWLVDDPLLRFTRQLERNDFDPFTETANLLPMFSCAAAVAEELNSPKSTSQRFDCQLNNGRKLDGVSAGTSWQTLVPHQDFRSGVILMESLNVDIRRLEPDEIRQWFRDRGICLSAYDGGIIRLSMPTRPWRNAELDLLASAFATFDDRPCERSTTIGIPMRQRRGSQGGGLTVGAV